MQIYDSKGVLEKREKRGNPLSTTYLDEVAATAVVAGAVAYGVSKLDLLPDFREALYNFRHASGTVKDMALGGPEGMRAARSLDEAISIVESARASNVEAAGSLEGYMAARKDLVGQLSRAYRENETFVREAERLKLQVEGALKSTFEIGNNLKPDFMEGIDNAIIRLYGQDAVQAREKSEQVKEFYRQARKFYDAQEKSEHTVKEFCQYLERVKTESEAQNQKFNELFPGIIAQVREGYETEDIVFAQRREKDFSESRVAKTESEIKDFRKNVDGTYEEVRQEMPIREYSETNWVDIATNPVSIGLAAAMIGYAGSRFFLPGIVRNPITKVFASPVTVPLWGVKKVGRGVASLARKIIGKFKKSGNTQNAGQPEESRE